jgi:hypothetical protein
MRACPILIAALLLSACSDDAMTRNFSLSRDAAPETMASVQMPLSAPPLLTERPARPGALAPNRTGEAAEAVAAGSPGQEALLQAAGPAAEANVRTTINENAGLVYPDPGYVDRLMSWTPPPGYTPLFNQKSPGWFSRLF